MAAVYVDTGMYRPEWEVYKYGGNLYKAIYHTRGIPIYRRVQVTDLSIGDIDYIRQCLANGIDVYYDSICKRFDTGKGILLSRGELAEIIKANDKQVKNFKDEYKRYYTNLIRAKNTVEEIALCNEFDFFITVTVNPKNGDREDLADLYKRFVRSYIRKKNDEIRRFCKVTGNDYSEEKISYLIVPELHADGKSWHLHGLIKMGEYYKTYLCDYNLRINEKLPGYIRNKALTKGNLYYDKEVEDEIGFNVIEKIKSREKCARYVTKYVCKGFGQLEDKIDKGKDLYWCSKGLKRRILVEGVSLNEDNMEIDREYSGENCTVIWYHMK